jgi:hypothetical protein
MGASDFDSFLQIKFLCCYYCVSSKVSSWKFPLPQRPKILEHDQWRPITKELVPLSLKQTQLAILKRKGYPKIPIQCFNNFGLRIHNLPIELGYADIILISIWMVPAQCIVTLLPSFRVHCHITVGPWEKGEGKKKRGGKSFSLTSGPHISAVRLSISGHLSTKCGQNHYAKPGKGAK